MNTQSKAISFNWSLQAAHQNLQDAFDEILAIIKDDHYRLTLEDQRKVEALSNDCIGFLYQINKAVGNTNIG